MGTEGIGEEVQRFAAPEDLLQAGVTDAVMICTPHYSHPSLAIRLLTMISMF